MNGRKREGTVEIPHGRRKLHRRKRSYKAQAEVDGQQACMQDAFSFCGQFIPDRDRVGACLFANKSRISPPCREAMKRYTPRTASAR